MPNSSDRGQVVFRAAEVARQLGVSASTLRSWDRRYGICPTVRSPGAHRRYSPADVQRLHELRKLVAEGVPTAEAANIVHGKTDVPVPSFQAQLRQRFPNLMPASLNKRAVAAISRAIEDEWGVRKTDGLLVGGFQRERHYRPVQHRWSQLCRGASVALVFADFAERCDPAHAPTQLPLNDDSPLLQEWFLIAVAPGFRVFLAGWERPTTITVQDHDRTFETLWTMQSDIVAAALHLTARLAQETGPDFIPALQDAVTALAASDDDSSDATTALTNRMVAYAADATTVQRRVR